MEYDTSKLSNIINKHFSSIGPKLANKTPPSRKSFSDYLRYVNQNDSFFYAPVSHSEIENEILALPINKSYGLYSCPVDLLKASRHLICRNLSTLINEHSKIIPVFKANDESDPLLSVFNRIYEKLIYNRMINFIEKHDLLSKCQY